MTALPIGGLPATPLRLTEIDLCAWIAQAEPGDVLEYHRGTLAIDRLRGMSKLPRTEVDRVDLLADRAFAAAEQRLVHLVQHRLGTDHFSYLAIARPKPRNAHAALSAVLLAEAA